MKTLYQLLILCIVIIGISTEYFEGHNGRPHCKTDTEMKLFYWRNNNDPTVYWACKKSHLPAELFNCPKGKAFSTRTRNCIGWDLWEWEEPMNPPSMA